MNANNLDLSEEMADLMRVYAERADEMMKKEECSLQRLVYAMKRFLIDHEEASKCENKLLRLSDKLNQNDG